MACYQYHNTGFNLYTVKPEEEGLPTNTVIPVNLINMTIKAAHAQQAMRQSKNGRTQK